MTRAWIVAVVVLAGCIGTTPAAEPESSGPPAYACDYELDDYAGGVPRLMVHWDVPGHGRAMSGLDATVTLRLDGQTVAVNHTTTDCILFHMDDADADHIHVRVQDGECQLLGQRAYAYGGEFETVRIGLDMGQCPG